MSDTTADKEKKPPATTVASVLDNIEKILKIAKEIAVIVLSVLLLIKLLPLVTLWIEQLTNAQIASLNVLGVKLEIAQGKLQVAAGVGQPQPSASDKVVSPVAATQAAKVKEIESELAKSEASTPTVAVPPVLRPTESASAASTTFWVYLGIAKGQQLPSRNFRIATLPAKGQLIVSATDVYKRVSAPISSTSGDWFLAEAKGVLRANQSVRVVSVNKIESTEAGSDVVWAEVQTE